MDCQTVAIVIPWFGRELRGGAELQAWNLATRLSARGFGVEVLTTCCASFQHDWSVNELPAGVSREPEGFAIRRFPVEQRDRAAFDRVCGHLLGLDPRTLKPGVSPISAEEEKIFTEHLIRCPALLSYLKTDGWQYSAFIFLPYLYGPILDGLPLVASRALLQPCLHDEAYAYLRCVQRAVFAARKLLWLSTGEYELGCRLFGPAIWANSLVGMAGVEPRLVSTNPASDAAVEALQPFVLLLGRKDVGKGTALAVNAFRAYHAAGHSALKLVVAGPGPLVLHDPSSNIHDLGFVSEDLRGKLLQSCEALLQPSPNESFSRVIFEAWQAGQPVIALRSCLATACAVQASGGGWLGETTEDWTALLAKLESLPKDELRRVGQRGATYGASIADWDKVMDRYEDVLRPLARAAQIDVRIHATLSVNQAQRLRLWAGTRELGTWDLAPDQPRETGWLEAAVGDPEPVLRFETDQPGQVQLPDARTYGFCLMELQVEISGAVSADLRFTSGWNRSRGGPGSIGPRWSTGSAEVSIRPVASIDPPRAIHQVLPNLSYGDAIGNHTLWIRDRLQSLGYVSEIFARHIAPKMLDQAYSFAAPDSLPPEAAIIYHHSIGSEITPWVCGHPGPKALIYHNITPAEYFEPYRPEMAALCRHGRQELPGLAEHFPVSVGDSRFNADELAACGFQDPGVLPLCVDPAHWAFPPDEGLMARLQDGRTNILFVGRIVPNKRQEDLIYTFKFWLEEDPEARLFLVGTAEVSSFYLQCLEELARALRVDHAVHFVGQVDDAQLHAYYRCASMFWCLSEHEGFCVPLIEACAFGVPVVARAKGAVPATLGNAGLLLDGDRCPVATVRQIAAAWRKIDRQQMVARAARYSASQVTQELVAFIDRLVASPALLFS